MIIWPAMGLLRGTESTVRKTHFLALGILLRWTLLGGLGMSSSSSSSRARFLPLSFGASSPSSSLSLSSDDSSEFLPLRASAWKMRSRTLTSTFPFTSMSSGKFSRSSPEVFLSAATVESQILWAHRRSIQLTRCPRHHPGKLQLVDVGHGLALIYLDER